jgi:hypothetical protein
MDRLQLGQQMPGLEHEPEVLAPERAALPVRHPGQVTAPPRHRPRGRREDPGQHVEQRGLARTRRTHDRHALARCHRQGDAPERRHLVQSQRAVRLDDVGRDEPVRRCHRWVAGRRLGGRERSREGRHGRQPDRTVGVGTSAAGRVPAARADHLCDPGPTPPVAPPAPRIPTTRRVEPTRRVSRNPLENRPIQPLPSGRPRRRNLPTPFRKERRSDSNRGPHQRSNLLDSRDDARGPGALTGVREASDPDTPRPGQLILGRVSPCLRTSRPKACGFRTFSTGDEWRAV